MAHANHNVTYCTKIVNMFVHENKMTAAARLPSSVFSVNWSMLLLLHVSHCLAQTIWQLITLCVYFVNLNE